MALPLERYIIRQLTDTLFQFGLHLPATSGDVGAMMVKKSLNFQDKLDILSEKKLRDIAEQR